MISVFEELDRLVIVKEETGDEIEMTWQEAEELANELDLIFVSRDFEVSSPVYKEEVEDE